TKTDGLAAEAGRGLAWMDGQTLKDGSVNASAAETFESVKAAREKRQSQIDAGLISPLDFENDEISEIFGHDKGGNGLVGYSSHISKKQASHASLAAAVIAANKTQSDNAPRVETQLIMDETMLLKYTQRITNTVIQEMRKQLQNQAPDNNHQVPDDENPEHSSNPDLVGSNPPGNEAQTVLLYNREKITVATGYVVQGKEGEKCHGVMVLSDERKICLEAIYDGSCPLPDRPQADNRNYLHEYIVGEWVIWPIRRMEFVQYP
ncbi:hypothetical protein MKX01_029270, partial [Papaver californicum]